MRPVGSTWLIAQYGLAPTAVTHRSKIGGRRQSVVDPQGPIEETFTRNYWPGDHPLDHVEFLLKYEEVNLDLLEQVFRRIRAGDVDAYIAAAPTSKYRRRIGFLYEFLNPGELRTAVSGNYVPVLEPKRYFTGKPLANPRWRVVDNLLGGAGFCPMIRRTPGIEEKLKRDWTAEIRRLTAQTDPRLLARAVNFLYLKETKSSFEIEHEAPTRNRTERFVRVLAQAGRVPPETLLDEARLVALQNLIVDPRFAERTWRKGQNYVGETLADEKVHYVCPPPTLVPTLMSGLRTFRVRGHELPASLRAAVTSFGFVYVHPFEDGNGRLHRLLLHESLVCDGFTVPNVILPFSAVMLRDRPGYDRVLESFSRTVESRVRYSLDRRGHLTIDNAREAEAIWRYPDLTPHVDYVLDLIATTVTRDLPEELGMLQRLDDAAASIKEIVDLPGGRLNFLLRLLHQHRGTLSRAKRSSEFKALTDEEVRRVEAAFKEAFEL